MQDYKTVERKKKTSAMNQQETAENVTEIKVDSDYANLVMRCFITRITTKLRILFFY